MMNKKNKKIHIGCFDQIHDGWINTDITPHIFITHIPFLPYVLYRLGKISEERFRQHKKGIFKKVKYLNVKKRFPIKDGACECVYASHLFEHLYYDDARHCVSEIHRILEKEGIIRIAVPDLDTIIKNYDPMKSDEFCSALFESDQSRVKNQHHWMYNEASLKKLLHVAGFKTVDRCLYRKGKCPDVEKIDNRPDSLFVEAIK